MKGLFPQSQSVAPANAAGKQIAISGNMTSRLWTEYVAHPRQLKFCKHRPYRPLNGPERTTKTSCNVHIACGSALC